MELKRAKLIICAECGKQVSSSINSCPHCGLDPHTYICSLCNKTMKRSEGIGIWKYAFVHEACIKNIAKNFVSQKIKCKVCHNWFPVYQEAELLEQFSHADSSISKLRYSFFSPHIKTEKFYCPNCGEEKFIHRCSFCGMFMSEKDNTFLWDIDDKSSLRRDSWNMHKSCKSLAKRMMPQKHGCFIATAVYGENSAEVKTLCIFRDDFLVLYHPGRLFIRFYYLLSPSIALLFTKNTRLKLFMCKFFISPIFQCIKKFMLLKGRKA